MLEQLQKPRFLTHYHAHADAIFSAQASIASQQGVEFAHRRFKPQTQPSDANHIQAASKQEQYILLPIERISEEITQQLEAEVTLHRPNCAPGEVAGFQ